MLDKIAMFDAEKNSENTSRQIREKYQYGTELSLRENLYKEIFTLAQEVIAKTKVIIEE